MARTAVMRPCLNKRDAQHAANLGKGPVSFHPLHFHAGCIEIKLFPTEFATKNIPVPTNIGIIKEDWLREQDSLSRQQYKKLFKFMKLIESYLYR